MLKIEMNKNDLENLDKFLERVDLKGKTEAIALVRIANSMASAKQVDDAPKKLKRKTKEDGE